MAARITAWMQPGMGCSGGEPSGRPAGAQGCGDGSEMTVRVTRMGDAVCRPSGHAEHMTTRDPLKSYCPHCGEQFGNARQGVGLKAHLWKAHGIPGEATFNGKLVKFPREGSEQ